MSVLDYLLKEKLVDDKKDFLDLFSVGAFKIDGKPLRDPQMDIKNVKKITIGCRIVAV